MKNYLFLDIDGVLNTGQYSNYLVNNGLCETDGYLFDPEAVKNLQTIIEKTDAKMSHHLNRIMSKELVKELDQKLNLNMDIEFEFQHYNAATHEESNAIFEYGKAKGIRVFTGLTLI